jgi:hypothetical protein
VQVLGALFREWPAIKQRSPLDWPLRQSITFHLRKWKVMNMVSGMESDFTPRQALAEAERGAVAIWIDYPPTPWWYFPGAGAWASALVLTVTELHGLWGTLALLALVAVELVFLVWYRRLRGAWPKITNPPTEFKAAIRAFLIGATVLTATIGLLAVFAGVIVAVSVTFVGVMGGLLWYEKAYQHAAARTRRRVESTA